MMAITRDEKSLDIKSGNTFSEQVNFFNYLGSAVMEKYVKDQQQNCIMQSPVFSSEQRVYWREENKSKGKGVCV